MKNKVFFLLVGALLAVQFAQAQKCRTPTTPPVQYLLQEETHERSAALTDGPYVVRIFVHILRDFDGTNVAMTDSALNANLQQMANYFQPHGICFILVGQDFINHTGLNRYFDIDDDDMVDDLTAVNPHPDAIDIYFHRTMLPDSPGNLVGYAYNIPSGKLSVEAYTRGTLEHEMGHCLGLYHTFETDFGLECPSGYNCKAVGDKVCDTPADYDGSPYTANCVYGGNETTTCSWAPPHSPYLHSYNPLVNNIMSYNDSCYSGFTPGQGERMRDKLNKVNFLEDCLAPENFIVTGTWGGEVSPAAKNTLIGGNIGGAGDLNLTAGARGVFNAGSLVLLLPGTYIAPGGSNSVVIKINDLCDDGGAIAGNPSDDRSELSKTVEEKSASELNVAPNPFAGSTTVTYSLTEQSRINILVLNAMGGQVATLVSENAQDAGEYRCEFDAKDLPAGIYFLVMQKDGERRAKRLALTR